MQKISFAKAFDKNKEKIDIVIVEKAERGIIK